MFDKKLTVPQVNYINIGLMLVSFVCALYKPFETFLFVYAFLGPLHYLTEISWLHDKKYFTKRRYDVFFLLAIGVILSLDYWGWIPNMPAGAGTFLIFIAFISALAFAITSRWGIRALIMIGAAFVANFIYRSETYDAIFGAFLPTLIHVFIFTGLFILVGALRGRDLSGILSLVAFIVITAAIFYIHPDRSHYQVGAYVKGSYGYLKSDGSGFTQGFITLNEVINRVFRLHDFGTPTMPYSQFVDSINSYFYSNPLMLAIMTFIGFAYMYHYLNWFSKTSVIQWNNISRTRLAVIIFLWLGSVGLYAYDYSVGLKWLFFLSFTHVLLEFPLNHITFINIGKEVKSIVVAGRFAKTQESIASPPMGRKDLKARANS